LGAVPLLPKARLGKDKKAESRKQKAIKRAIKARKVGKKKICETSETMNKKQLKIKN